MYSDNFYNKDISLHNRPPFCSLHHNSGRQLRSCAALKVLLAYYPSIPVRPEEFHNVPSLDHIHIFPDIQNIYGHAQRILRRPMTETGWKNRFSFYMIVIKIMDNGIEWVAAIY